MKRILTLTLFFVFFAVSLSFADDVAKGKSLYNDPKLGGATKGKSCASCHSESAAVRWLNKKEFSIMGSKAKSLEEAINLCIEKAMGGKALDPKGTEMKALLAYIKSLKK